MVRMGLCLVLSLVCGIGCVRPFELTVEAPWAQHDKQPPPPAVAPITAEQVTAQNAHKMAQALLDEMDRESNQEALSPARK
jgi:hypothetical protein